MKSNHTQFVVTALVIGLVMAVAVRAQSAQRPILKVGVLPDDLHLDGVLDEPAWAETDSIPNLTMVEPLEGALEGFTRPRKSFQSLPFWLTEVP